MVLWKITGKAHVLHLHYWQVLHSYKVTYNLGTSPLLLSECCEKMNTPREILTLIFFYLPIRLVGAGCSFRNWTVSLQLGVPCRRKIIRCCPMKSCLVIDVVNQLRTICKGGKCKVSSGQ